MTELELQISPEMRNAIRGLRKQWHSVEVVRADDGTDEDGLVIIMVQPSEDDEPRPRAMWEDAEGNVYHQSRTKINGHYGPEVKYEEPTVTRAPARVTKRRARPQRFGEVVEAIVPPAATPLWQQRFETNNKLTVANRDFTKTPSRSNMRRVQMLRTALNDIDECIAQEYEASHE